MEAEAFWEKQILFEFEDADWTPVCQASSFPNSWKVLLPTLSIPEMWFLVTLDSSTGGHQTQSESVPGAVLRTGPLQYWDPQDTKLECCWWESTICPENEVYSEWQLRRILAESDSPVSAPLMLYLLLTRVSYDLLLSTNIFLIFFTFYSS